jgi:hypothetical protein
MFLSDVRGNVAIVTALAAPLIAAAGAFGTETAYWYYRDIQLQAAADAAAYTGALVRRMGSDTEQVTAAVTDTATKNGFEASVGEVTVNMPPTLGTHITNKAVEVFLEEHRKRIFTAIFMDGDVPIGARAVAVFQDASSACVLALHASKSKAALFSGSSSVTFTNCSVMSNSIANDGLTVQGAATLTANCAYSAGGAQTTAGLTLTECDAAKTEVAPVGDPFSDVVAPDTSGGCQGTGGST